MLNYYFTIGQAVESLVFTEISRSMKNWGARLVKNDAYYKQELRTNKKFVMQHKETVFTLPGLTNIINYNRIFPKTVFA
jgi:hypothetical protein